MPISFTKRLHEPILRGEVTTTIRIWYRPRVKAGNCYPFEGGHVRVTSIREIALEQITPKMARESGFEGVVDLLKTAKHGHGERVYFIEFEYEEL